jgi:hypothetical protein
LRHSAQKDCRQGFLPFTKTNLIALPPSEIQRRESFAWLSLQLLSDGLKSTYPSAVVVLADLEAISTSLGTEGGSPRVVADETKFSVTDGAALCCIVPKILATVAHFRLLWASRGQWLVSIPGFRSHFAHT